MDLFAGCGGMTRGFVDTDRFSPVLAVESDGSAASTLVCQRMQAGR
jgi:DNA (cytosine-5)-methyltransferase 1